MSLKIHSAIYYLTQHNNDIARGVRTKIDFSENFKVMVKNHNKKINRKLFLMIKLMMI